MPTPHPSQETQDEWIGRCVPTLLNDGTTDDQQQALAICFQMWRDAKRKPKKDVKGDFIQNPDTGRFEGSEPGGGSGGGGGGGGGGGDKTSTAELDKAGDLSGPEQFAISDYTANGYNYLNGALRKEETVSSSTQNQINLLDKITQMQSFTSDGTVYRGIEGKKFAGKLKEGAVLNDKAFLSTSSTLAGVERALKDTGVSSKATVSFLKIAVKAGTKAYAPSNGRGESEILFGRGSSIKITGKSTDSQGRSIITAEML